MKRRGLNFITDQHEENMDEECIDKMEKEIDNVAPKIIAILGLSKSCDTGVLKQQLSEYCEDFKESLMGKKNKKNDDQEIVDQDLSGI